METKHEPTLDELQGCLKGKTEKPFTNNELIGAMVDQASYALHYQHGENIQELQKACKQVEANSAFIFCAINSHDELVNSLKKLERWFSDEKIRSKITTLDQWALDEIRQTLTETGERLCQM